MPDNNKHASSDTSERSLELFRLALDELLPDNLDGAISALEESALLIPHHRTLLELGRLYLKRGERTKAMIALAAASTLNKQPIAPIMLAEIYCELGDYNKAKSLADEALDHNPQYAYGLRFREKLHALITEQNTVLDSPSISKANKEEGDKREAAASLILGITISAVSALKDAQVNPNSTRIIDSLDKSREAYANGNRQEGHKCMMLADKHSNQFASTLSTAFPPDQDAYDQWKKTWENLMEEYEKGLRDIRFSFES